MSVRILEDLKDLGEKTLDTAKETIEHPGEAAEKVVNTVKEAVQHPIDTAEKVVDKIVDTVKEAASDAAEDIKDATEEESAGSKLAEERDKLRKEVEFKAYFDKLVQICIPEEDFMDLAGGIGGGIPISADGFGIVSANFLSYQVACEGWSGGRPFSDATAVANGARGGDSAGVYTVGPGLASTNGMVQGGRHYSLPEILSMWKVMVNRFSQVAMRACPQLSSMPQCIRDIAVDVAYQYGHLPKGWSSIQSPQDAAALCNRTIPGWRAQARAAICMGLRCGSGKAKECTDAYYNPNTTAVSSLAGAGAVDASAAAVTGSISAPVNVQGWNLQATVNYLTSHATRKSRHICAQAVREGLQAGGIKMNGHPSLARQYIGYLPSIGFQCVAQVPTNNMNAYLSQAQIGDIAVYCRPNSPSAAGHICVCCGTIWCSDFVQMSPFVYRSLGNTVMYIFRRGAGGGRAAAAFGGSLTGGTGVYELTPEEKAQQELEKLAKNPALVKNIKKIAERLNKTGSDGRTVAQRLLAWHQYREYNGSDIGFREYK